MINVCLDTSPLLSGHAIRGIGTYTRELTAAFAAMPEIIRLVDSQEADVIHYPFFDLFKPTLPFLAGSPVLVTIHDVIPLEFPDYYPVGIKGSLALLKQLAALRFVSHIITDSEYSKKRIIEQMHVAEEKVTVVYLAPSPGYAAATKEECAKINKKFNLTKPYILYVGDINYNKNIPQLIKLLKFIPDDIDLVCVGSQFYPHDIIEWRRIEQQLVLSDVGSRVHFLTDIPIGSYSYLNALYSNALCYVQPSLSEGFGLPVLEAARCGCPVVSSSGGSLPEVAGPAALIATPDAESLAECVMHVEGWSAKERKQRILQGHLWANRFTWDKVAQDTLSIYEKVLATA